MFLLEKIPLIRISKIIKAGSQITGLKGFRRVENESQIKGFTDFTDYLKSPTVNKSDKD